jgi:hypothetical protein
MDIIIGLMIGFFGGYWWNEWTKAKADAKKAGAQSAL